MGTQGGGESWDFLHELTQELESDYEVSRPLVDRLRQRAVGQMLSDERVDPSGAVNYIDKTISNAATLGEGVTWTNAEVLQMVVDIRSELIESGAMRAYINACIRDSPDSLAAAPDTRPADFLLDARGRAADAIQWWNHHSSRSTPREFVHWAARAADALTRLNAATARLVTVGKERA